MKSSRLRSRNRWGPSSRQASCSGPCRCWQAGASPSWRLASGWAGSADTMRRLVMERLCLMLGSALVLAAVCLYVYDRLEDARAGAQAALAVSQLRQSQSIAAVSETEQPADSAESLPTEDAES